MFGLGLPELIIIGLILMMLFGAKQLPKLARSFSESAKEIREGFQTGADTKTPSADKE